MTPRDLRERWLSRAQDDPDLTAELESLLASGDAEGVRDRFYRELEFGTGGLRGVIGAGTNRMNIYTVRQATQGLAAYLLQSGGAKRVAIAYDSRVKSELFAKNAAAVLAANGITAYIYPRLTPTPALSFAVRSLGCGAGICVTASHNPAKYNGYKVYGADGCQITNMATESISKHIKTADPFNAVRLVPFEDGLADGNIRYIGEETVDAYLDAVWAVRAGQSDLVGLKVVYTPLNGAGLECVTRILKRAGVTDLTVVPEQSEPDGKFPTCPYPNPEIAEAMRLGISLSEQIEADLLLATDPDCDRCGVAVRHKGRYVLVSGNEMGVLLLDYIARTRAENGTLPERPVVVKTIVTTGMAARVAAHYGFELRNVLTGFKYIGELIGGLERQGEVERFVFGFEESYGYLPGAYVRDKDAVSASLLICDMADWYRARGMTLIDALEALYERHGYFASGLDSREFEGEDGFAVMQGLMRRLREIPPTQIAGQRVTERRDYLDTEHTGLPLSDMLQFVLEDESLLTVRPSGTEPKLKIYCSAVRSGRESASGALSKLRHAASELILGAAAKEE